MVYLAAAHAQSGIGDGLTLLVASAVLTVVGAFVAFDLFGFVSKYRIPPSRKIIELGIPDVAKLVGGLFLCIGVPGLVLCLVIALIVLAR